MAKQSMKDNINPNHYKNGKSECIEALESATVGKNGSEAIYVANTIRSEEHTNELQSHSEI